MFSLRSPWPAGSPRTTSHSRVTAYCIALVIVLADQGIKYWVHEFTPYGWRQPVTPFFNLVHVWNYGAAFSFLADAGGWQRFFFGCVALIVALWLVVALAKPLPWVERLGYASVLGGALGNGLDRALRGYVVDFLDFYAVGWHWPAFNIADMGIVCGAGILMWLAIRNKSVDHG